MLRRLFAGLAGMLLGLLGLCLWLPGVFLKSLLGIREPDGFQVAQERAAYVDERAADDAAEIAMEQIEAERERLDRERKLREARLYLKVHGRPMPAFHPEPAGQDAGYGPAVTYN